MILNIIKLLQSNKFYGVSDTVEIAKGKYAMPDNFRELKEQAKRLVKISFKNGKRVQSKDNRRKQSKQGNKNR